MGAGPLDKRELEVAGFIAERMSNQEIAARLFISDRTVASRVGLCGYPDLVPPARVSQDPGLPRRL